MQAKNHFSRCCLSKVNAVEESNQDQEEEDSSSEEERFVIKSVEIREGRDELVSQNAINEGVVVDTGTLQTVEDPGDEEARNSVNRNKSAVKSMKNEEYGVKCNIINKVSTKDGISSQCEAHQWTANLTTNGKHRI